MENAVLRILEIARGQSCECEVYGESVRTFGVEIHRGAVESMNRSNDAGVGIRLVREGRIGFAFSSDITAAGLDRVVAEARANAACSSPMDVDCLADDREGADRGNLYPELPPEGGEHDKVERVRAMEGACFGFDAAVVNTEVAGYDEVVGDIFVASTRGFQRCERRGFCSSIVSAIAQRDDDVRSGTYVAQALHPAHLDFEAVGREAARRAMDLLGAKRIATKRYPVVIDGTAFIDIVELLAEALSAEMVVKGMSPLAGKRGETVARDVVSLIDDPFRRDSCFNASFDAEGVPKERCALIESGILSGYLHNAYSSRKMGVKMSGNAVRKTFKNLPVPGPSNLYIAPGTRTTGEIISGINEGVFVQDIMGMHTADTISGDFSVGMNGFHIRGGATAGPVSGMTISGTILELLHGVVEVGSDLIFVGTCGSPSVLVEGLSVSGT